MIRTLLVSSLTFALLFGVNAQPSIAPEPSAEAASFAHFDLFFYNGEDDFYARLPLTSADQFYNPILPGWYSDPSICTNGKDYFLVTSTFAYFPGVPIFHSEDLINWKQVGHVLTRPSQLKLTNQKVSEGIFAPAISYNPQNKTYYMITTNIGGGNFFVKTKDPFGEWSDPIWLPEVHGIDPSFFFDDNGRAYIVNNDAPEGTVGYDGHRAIRIQEFDVLKDKTFGPRKMLVNGGVNLADKPVWIEGPHIYKIKGKYLLMAAEGGTGPDHREVIFSGDSPMGTFTPWKRNPILTQKHLDPSRPDPITCAGHADLIQSKDGSWWSVFLACRPIENRFENLGRETFLMPVTWSEDGFPYLTKDDEVVPRILKMKGANRQANTTFGNFSKRDDFDKAVLGMDWMTLRGAASNLYSLSKKPGYLSLQCIPATAAERKELAYVSRRLQHHKFRASTTVDFQPQDDNDAAGMLLLKDEGHHYFLAIRKSGNARKVTLEKTTPQGTEVTHTMTLSLSKGTIQLKIESDGTSFNFYAAEESGDWKTVAKGIDAHFLSTANSFGFTGTNVGLYATRHP
ncbi:glycoside hydrolase family 43 protein [Pseudochryseolinea flava]|uniref:Glycoside hydrolase family 43 protein n=1 Tax=Pseudochryseolinea flava TaxID=2059302 RepID=A0A364Y6L5_9BACT|nr:glycoside hydrolase family 43 protein [Pseudochryseolinea flava]RAW02580.1 glycoside hydrolase family 43 protein [Pseudochryseolinea flava]